MKTAGTSFEIALSKYLSEDDIVTPIAPDDEQMRRNLGYMGARNYIETHGLWISLGLKKAGNRFFNHISARELRRKLDRHTWDTFFKCTIVRNPYDMAVSQYFWEHRGSTASKEHFQSWLVERQKKLNKNRAITHIGNDCAVDFMIRFEHFDDDIVEFAHRVGLPASLATEFGAIRAKGAHRPKNASAKEMFQGFDRGREIIERVFAHEIRQYGYACD